MRLFLKFLGIIFGIILITAIHISLTFILPRPFSFINIIFVAIFLVLFLTESGSVVWMAFLTNFIIELFTATTPFGVLLFSGTVSILGAYWLYRFVIVSRSWYAGLALSAMTLVIYRLLYTIFLLLLQLFARTMEINWQQLFIFYLWEITLSSLAVGGFFLLLIFLRPSFREPMVSKGAFPKW